MSLIDEIKIKSLSDAQEILKAAGTEDILDFEKAHKDGDLHPNGKYVWVSSANGGKGDWRTLNGRIHKKHQATIGGGASSSAVSSTTGASSKKDNSSTKTTVVSKKSSKPDFSKLKSWAEPFVKLFNEPENLKSIAKTIDYIDMNKPMKVSKIGSRDSKVFLLRYINKSGVPQVEYFSYDGSSAPGMYGWSANAAVKKIFEQNADVLPPLKIDSSGNVLGIKMVDNNSKTTSSKSTKTTSSIAENIWKSSNRWLMIDYLYSLYSIDVAKKNMKGLKSNSEDYKNWRNAYLSYMKRKENDEQDLGDKVPKISDKRKLACLAVVLKTMKDHNLRMSSLDANKITLVKTNGVGMLKPMKYINILYDNKLLGGTMYDDNWSKEVIEDLGFSYKDNYTPVNGDDKNNSKSNKTSKTETYSHDINGVSVSVSKNKDGSYTLEANGKKVKSDDPSFFKDKLTPRVKKALAKEVGIDVKNPTKQFDVKQIGDFISSIKTTHGVVKFIPKNGAIYLVGKRDDYIGDCDEEEKTIELRQDDLSNVKRDREAIQEISDALQEKFGFVRKITYKENPKYHLKKAYMKIVLKPSK